MTQVKVEMEKEEEEEGFLVVAIPIFPRFTALDAIGPYEVLNLLPNAKVEFVSHSGGLYYADLGTLSIKATTSFNDLPRPDVIVVPGGIGTRSLLNDQPLLDWIRKAHETTLYTTSVCTGSLLLGAAGLLDGLEATTHWNAYDQLARQGAIPVPRRVVQQGKIITAAGVSSGIDMAIQLAAILRGEEIAKCIQLYIEYDPQPPYDVGSPSKAGEELVAKTKQFATKVRVPEPNNQKATVSTD